MSDSESEDYSDTESEIIESNEEYYDSDINTEDSLDINKLDDLREEIIKYVESTSTTNDSKLLEIYKYKPLYDKEYYDSKVLLQIADFSKFSIFLEEVKTKEQSDLWSYFKISTSSIATNKNPGKLIRFLVKEVYSEKYIGILALGDDILNSKDRDTSIGWDMDNHYRKMKNIVNIWCCVGLQPLAFNYNIGKLLCSLCFSKEVFDAFKNKYNCKIAAITTFGVNGRAPQYECLKCIKHIGYTKGYGTQHLSKKLYFKAIKLLNENGYHLSGSTMKIWRFIFKKLQIPTILLNHGIFRAIYIGYTSKDSKQYLQGYLNNFECEMESVEIITEKWKNRWGKRRIDNLIKSGKNKDNKTAEWTYDIFNTVIPENIKPENIEIVRSVKEFNEEMYNKLPKLTNSYIAGLLDGDGTILYDKHSLIPRIEISQCDPYAIFALYKQFGGTIISVIPKNKNARPQYKWTINKCEELLLLLKNNCIMKSQRAEVVLKLYYELNVKKNNYNIPLLKELFESYENVKKIYTPEIEEYYKDRINEDYIAGLFDAEGCITFKTVKNSISVSLIITQRSNPYVLKYIKSYYDNKYNLNFSITLERLLLYSYESTNKFIKTIESNILIKKDQIECFKEVVKCRNNNIDYNRDNYADKLSNLKRHIYKIDFKLEEKNKDKDIERDLKLVYTSGVIPIRKKKERKKKDYDRISHIVNITMATTNSKRVISDDIIFEVKRKLESGMKQCKIIEEMQLTRDTVSKIARGILLPLSATKEECMEKVCKKIERKTERGKLSETDKKKIDGENTAISKRAYNKDKCLEILNYTYENIGKVTQTMIGEKYSLSFTQINNLLNGKTLLYRREFDNDEEYDEYLELVEKVKSIDFSAISRTMAKVKVRRIPPDIVVNVMLYSRNNPRMTRKDIGKEFKITDEQVRSIVTGKTAVFEFEFPINGITWEEYNL